MTGSGTSVDVDLILAEVATAHGLDNSQVPDLVVDVGTVLLYEAMPLLKASTHSTHAQWLPVLAEAFVEWARRAHEKETLPPSEVPAQGGGAR